MCRVRKVKKREGAGVGGAVWGLLPSLPPSLPRQHTKEISVHELIYTHTVMGQRTLQYGALRTLGAWGVLDAR